MYYLYMSSVCVVKYSGKNRGGPLSSDKYQQLLEIGLKTMAGESMTTPVVRRFIPSGVVGIKVNCLTRNLNSTPVALTDGISKILAKAGIDKNNIIIWERTSRELELAGYKLNASSFSQRCFGTDTNGVGYSRNFYSSGKVDSLVSRILTELVDYNINMPILKDHSIAGLSGCLKNMYGAVNNPNKYHDNNCDPYAADISGLEPIKSKNRLFIIDAVRVQYNGGPGYDSRYLADYGGLIISDDPVAADTIGLEIIENFRKIDKLPTLEKAGRPVKYLASAEQRGLGMANRDKINLEIIAVDKSGHESKATLL